MESHHRRDPQLDSFHPWNFPQCPLDPGAHFRRRARIAPIKLARGYFRPAVHELEERYGGEEDDVDAVFSKFFRELLSEGRQMYVDLASWHAITQGGAGQAESKAQEDDEQPNSHGAPGK